jgi:hypothetical protein
MFEINKERRDVDKFYRPYGVGNEVIILFYIINDIYEWHAYCFTYSGSYIKDCKVIYINI